MSDPAVPSSETFTFPAITGRPIRLGVLISGGGTTLANFLEQMQAGQLNAEIPLVIASRADCEGVERCKNWGLQCVVVTRKSFPSTQAFSAHIFDLCREHKVDLVTLAGFLSLIHIPDDYLLKVMNIHPSLIPAFCGPGFYGHHVHEAVVKRGCKLSGCTVHFADNEYDHGPIILQRPALLDGTETTDDVARKVFVEECHAYPEAIRLFAEGHLRLNQHRISFA
jgi:formyltetrahydrofolate-dependent phosphoribosylglycinamide formyltransferase